jgi:hypothetical protein
LGQAHGTPFTVPLLLHEINWSANPIASESILEGKYSNGGLDENQQLLLTHCKKKPMQRLLDKGLQGISGKENCISEETHADIAKTK